MELKVLATQNGYIQNRRVKPGEEIILDNEKQFSDKWMREVGWVSEKTQKKMDAAEQEGREYKPDVCEAIDNPQPESNERDPVPLSKAETHVL